jgi:hypothetical protein
MCNKVHNFQTLQMMAEEHRLAAVGISWVEEVPIKRPEVCIYYITLLH